MQPTFGIGKLLCHLAGNCAQHTVHLCRLLHPRGDVYRAAVNSDRSFGVTLLADHDITTVDPDPEGRCHPELSQIPAALPIDGCEHGIDRVQYFVVTDRLPPIPDRDQAVTLVEIDVSAEISDRF